MATYLGYYFGAANNGKTAFTYNPATKVLTATDSHVAFESVAGDYWAIKINEDYALAFDSDGLLIGDVVCGTTQEYPRVEFVTLGCGGLKHPIGTLTQSGMLYVQNVAEADALPATGMDIKSQVNFASGLFTTTVALNEAWVLTDSGNYLTNEGRLLVLRP